MDLEVKLLHILDLHRIMRNSYFFNSSIEDIEAYEKAHSCTTEFRYDGKNYVVVQTTKCTQDRISYSVKYYCEDVCIKKDIRFIKGILGEMKHVS